MHEKHMKNTKMGMLTKANGYLSTWGFISPKRNLIGVRMSREEKDKKPDLYPDIRTLCRSGLSPAIMLI